MLYGSKRNTYEEVASIPTPAATKTFLPISHHSFINQIATVTARQGYEITDRDYVLDNDGDRIFGVFKLKGNRADYSPLVGFRNTHDKSFSAGVCLGSQVMVCSNLSFGSDIVVFRKHTPNIQRDMYDILLNAMGQLTNKIHQQDDRYDRYKNNYLNTQFYHHMLVTAAKRKIISSSKIMKAAALWDKPEHPEFTARNMWSAFNTVTSVLKEHPNMLTINESTQRLHEHCDALVV